MDAGWTELMRAADRGDADAVDSLLRSGADQVAPRADLTPQRLAMRRGHIAVLRRLQRASGDEQQLERPASAAADAVVLRWYYPRIYWLVLAVLPAAAGLAIGVVRSSASAVVAGLIVSAFGAVLAALIVGLNGLERLAYDDDRLWYRSFRTWQGPVDLRTMRAVYLVPASSGAKLYLLQDDAGVLVTARTSHGFDDATVAALNATRTLRSLAVPANTSTLHPGHLAHIARRVLASSAVVGGTARALLERALADEAAMRVGR